MYLSRRDFLKIAAIGPVILQSRQSDAIGTRSLFQFGQLLLAGDPGPRETALEAVSKRITQRTSIAMAKTPKRVQLDAPDLHETPFLYLSGDRSFSLPSDRLLGKLRQFLTYGGFLLIDSAEGTLGGAFDASVRRLVSALYPTGESSLQLVPKKHVVYKSFYLLERPVGRIALSSAMEGVIRDNRIVIAYTQNDLGGAWAEDKSGSSAFECLPGGARQRELAYRMGVNLIMYALCQDYKTDQVHVPFILRRRRWRSGRR